MIQHQFNMRISRVLILILLCTIGILMITSRVVYGTMLEKPVWTTVEEQISSDNLDLEYYRVKTPIKKKNTIYVEGKTCIETKRFCIRISDHEERQYHVTVFVTPNEDGEFSIKFSTKKGNKRDAEIVNGKGTIVKSSETWYTIPGYKAVGSMPAGIYHLTIARALTDADADVSPNTKWWNGSMGGATNGYAYKEFLLKIKKNDENNLKLIQSSNVIKNNQKIQDLYEKNSSSVSNYKGSYVRYMDKRLNDISFVLNDPITKKKYPITKKKADYFQRVSNAITGNKDSDYEKLVKIYKYIAESFYYDVLAEAKGTRQYADPYKNLYNLRNKDKSPNSVNGKVATTCQGYASAIIALARAEDIPARLVYGQHISQPDKIWSDKTLSQLNKTTHYWVEAYANGEWIILDANMGNLNKWKRSSFSASGTWNDIGVITYAGFDPSKEVFANSYIYHGIYRGSNDGKYICNAVEAKQLKSFLNHKTKGTTNGRKLSKKYKSSNYATWGNGKSQNFETDGFGRVYRIAWPKEALTGTLNLKDFTALKYVTLYNNNISRIKISNCKALESLNANYNQLTSFYGATAKKLKKISLKGNKLTVAEFRDNGKKIVIKRSGKKGSFGLVYQKSDKKRVTIYAAKAPKGYTYKGIYNAKGKRLTKKLIYSFNPSSAGTYYVKYAKK